MPKINVMKVIESSISVISPRYTMKAGDLETIQMNSFNPMDSMIKSFRFGYMQGMKAAKAEMKKVGVTNV